ncbi:MAG: IS1380 family transposase [Burkholderiales bacterium]
MNDQSLTQCLLFPELFGKPVIARFDQIHGSSDGGGILLKAADRRLGLLKNLSGCLRDDRQPGKIEHELFELLAQRVYAIACGYPDANDAARLGDDPIHKMLLDRDPIDGDSLASQPTLSRFENGVGPRQLYRMGEALADVVIERQRRRLRGRARRITIDFDPTDDPTHGQQQLSFFNGHYDTWCYLPLMGFISFNKEPEQFLVASVLRPGNVHGTAGFFGVLRRLVERLTEAFPKADILVRLDADYATPEVLEFLDDAGLLYVVAMARNSVLKRHAEPLMKRARRLSRASGRTGHVYGECRYAARKWNRKRRVIIKAEVTRLEDREPRDNPRFVVTNLTGTPRHLYQDVYCERGDIENRIKELHLGLEIDRTSCSRFLANQFRVLLTAAAYVLMQELRLRAARTTCARSQVWTIRERFIKLGVHVVRSVRRIVLHLPASFPFIAQWRTVALALGARTG